MNARIRLYSIPDLLEENNFVVEEMPAYLAHFQNFKEIEGFQWQRLEDAKIIKIDGSQLLNTPTPPDQKSYNYVAIYAEDSEGQIDTQIAPAFYFVEKIEQRAKNTIALYLKLDCLNTFFDKWKGEMTTATYIARAHRDRFFLANKSNPMSSLIKIYDKTPEGDTFPMICKSEKRETIFDNAGGDSASDPLKFYLIFRTADDGRPCLDLCANRELLISQASEGGEPAIFDASNTIAGRFYYLLDDFSFNYDYSDEYGTHTSQTYTGGILRFDHYMHGVYINGASVVSFGIDVDRIRITKGRKVYYSTTDTLDAREISTFPYSTINAGTMEGQYLGDIKQLNKTDSKIVKVIECPYCPIEYSVAQIAGAVYHFDRTLFAYKSENEFPPFLRTYQLGEELPERVIRTDTQYSFRTICPNSSILGLKTQPAETMFQDPKLETSAYKYQCLVYDSFAKQIKFEDFAAPKVGTYTETALVFTYKQSANVSSALLFRVEPKPTATGAVDYMKEVESQENFPSVVVASRNNELALFSSSYLDYLKNGYNYEKKKRDENLAFQGAMATLQTLGSILSFALSPATGGGSATAGVGLAVGAATTFASMGMSAHQSGQELEQKINLLKSQSYSVSNIDDLDLFNGYGGNKAQLLTYEIREADFSRVEKRFRYFGYAVDSYGNPYEMGMMDSRYNFNYLKADPVFRVGNIPIPSEFLGDIAERIRAGITIFHRRFYDINGADDYWLNRDFENMETSIIEALEE